MMSLEDASKPVGKSVLIFSWFYAQPKELELVRRIYKKRGFTDITIQESLVKDVARPRGWYNVYQRSVKGDQVSQELQKKVYRDFDVVHAMSGGFLNLGLILAPKLPITFKHLVLDSTPILPDPSSFVRFARAYMKEHGLNVVNRIIPETVQTGYQTARWSVGAAYVRTKSLLKSRRRKLGQIPPDKVLEMEQWTRWASKASMLNRYEDMSQNAIESVFMHPGLETVTFLFNPEDPYLNQKDVERCVSFAGEQGLDVRVVHSPSRHIETIFRKPKLLFDSLDSKPALATAE